MSFALLMKKRRKALGLTQMALSELCGVPQSTISAVEKGSRVPTEETMRMIAAGLNTTIGALMSGENEKSPPATEASGADERERLVNLLMEVPDDRIQEAIDLLSTLQRVRRQ